MKTHVRRARLALSLVTIAALASCGGGGDSPDAVSSDGKVKIQAFVPTTTIPADANVTGMWSPAYQWPLISVHSAILPDGRVLTYGSDLTGLQTGHSNYDIWDSTGAPDAGHNTLPNTTGTDIFCSSQLLLPGSGNVFIAGGDVWNSTSGSTTNGPNNNSNVLNTTSNALARGNNMQSPRWYSSSITLINGETYIQGGSGGGAWPEIRGVDGTFRAMTAINTSSLNTSFPRNFVAPDGRVFGYDSDAGQMYYVNPTGTGSITMGAKFSTALSGGWFSSTAMYRPGHILQIGGNSNGAYTIDITGATPVVAATQSMAAPRQWVNATVLADGKVAATSGTVVAENASQPTNYVEIWDPQTAQWTKGPAATKTRMYHSNAILLPDGSVLTSGGGAGSPTLSTDPNQNNLSAEIYYPPYLFAAGGVRAARPAITTAPSFIDIGKTYGVDVSGAASVSRVTLVKTGSMSHSFNFEQRFLDLTFNSVGSHVTIQAPTRAGEAPPGYYMLFVFNEAGVPSVAKIVRMGIATDPNPATTPTIANPGAQTTIIGSAASLALSASDPNGDTLTYAATALPPGLTLNPATGLISGTATTNGSYNVVVTATDGVNTASASFGWTVQNPSPLTLATPPAPAFVATNGTATYTASATGGAGLVYQWNFGDGSATTAWSSSPSITHAFAAGGTYAVTVYVMDASGNVLNRSFTQVVYRPTTAGKPAASTNILVETPATGNARLWVVNQDNNSVSAFDAVTNAKLGEVAVGAAPRSIALASSGMLWVTNKQDATISVINPATRTVTRTIALPRGSQPFGVVMSPAAGATTGSTGASPLYGTSTAGTAFNDASTQPLTGVNLRTGYWMDSIQGVTSAGALPLHGGGGGGAASFTVPTGQYLVRIYGSAGSTSIGTINFVTNTGQVYGPYGTNQGQSANVAFDYTAPSGSWITGFAGAASTYVYKLGVTYAPVTSTTPTDAYVALEAGGAVLKFNTTSYAQTGSISVGQNVRHLSISANGADLYASRFVTPPLPGEGTAVVTTSATNGGEVVQIATATASVARTIVLQHSEKPDTENSGRGIPNYLGAAVISPDGTQAYVPSKQDNIKRGALRDGNLLNFQNTVRAISSRIDLGSNSETLTSRIDHDNASLASAAVFDTRGVYLFVALETSREVAVVNAFSGAQVLRVNVDRAPQGLALSADGRRLYVNNFVERSVSVLDLSQLLDQGVYNVPVIATLSPVATEQLAANVLLGKQLFYDARDTRLARDNYMSCAACHNDGGHDGRTWDFTGQGEGLRNTIPLRGRGGMGQGFLHWSANFDEVQDFEGQIRDLAGGSGLMSDAAFNTGTRNQPLGDKKAGVSSDLDALAAYLTSLNTFAVSPYRNADGTLSTAASAGKTVFQAKNCAQCHAGTAFTASLDATSLKDIGTIKPSSGKRLNGPLPGIDIPTLRDVWATAPYLHDGSAATLDAAVSAHNNVVLTAAELTSVVAYLREIGSDEASAPVPVAPSGTGLTGRYFNNRTLTGTAALTRIEAVNFTWGAGSPGTGIGVDNFSVRWTGTLKATTAGAYTFQTNTDDGVRLWVNGVQLVNNWTDHSATTNTSASMTLTSGQVVAIVMEYYEAGGDATAQLRWKPPGAGAYVAIPSSNLYPQ